MRTASSGFSVHAASLPIPAAPRRHRLVLACIAALACPLVAYAQDPQPPEETPATPETT